MHTSIRISQVLYTTERPGDFLGIVQETFLCKVSVWYLCMSLSLTDCLLSEQVSITRSLYLSRNVVKHTELQKTFLVHKERAWRLFDKYRRVKVKVSAILSLK